MSFPGGPDGKESASKAGDPGSICESGISKTNNTYLVYYFYRGNPDRESFHHLLVFSGAKNKKLERE